MNIINETRLDKDELCECLAKAQPINKIKYLIITIIILVVGIALLIWGLIKNDGVIRACAIATLAMGGVMGALLGLLVYTSSKKGLAKRVSANPALASGITYNYVFKENEFVVGFNNSNDGAKTIKYDSLYKVSIIDGILYLYPNQSNCLIVKFSSEENKNELIEVFKKYIK